MELTRRSYLRATAALAVVGTTGLAGCGSADADAETDAETARLLPTEPNYDGWFDNADAYRGTYDLRGRHAVTVTVGAKDSLGYFSFDPAAIAVSPGTTVTWEWSGEGGAHNVVALEGAFRAPLTDRAGTTFARTFDETGVYPYYCTPHRGMGMKGAVVVE
ncbi:halocyanin domain-containing protein [Haloprofundus halobius]|uniref:halocyanin domain-containing protein n=1 Tax=Haloprofundus halobius TaxID=2876194 RepID=UPI001CCD5DF4|nr:halocyanin domain-containing protein [Haloprofundus halobius]